jgi:hypothetical protein
MPLLSDRQPNTASMFLLRQTNLSPLQATSKMQCRWQNGKCFAAYKPISLTPRRPAPFMTNAMASNAVAPRAAHVRYMHARAEYSSNLECQYLGSRHYQFAEREGCESPSADRYLLKGGKAEVLERSLTLSGWPSAAARYIWSYGADFGRFGGVVIDAYIKDLPIERVEVGVLISYEKTAARCRPNSVSRPASLFRVFMEPTASNG